MVNRDFPVLIRQQVEIGDRGKVVIAGGVAGIGQVDNHGAAIGRDAVRPVVRIAPVVERNALKAGQAVLLKIVRHFRPQKSAVKTRMTAGRKLRRTHDQRSR